VVCGLTPTNHFQNCQKLPNLSNFIVPQSNKNGPGGETFPPNKTVVRKRRKARCEKKERRKTVLVIEHDNLPTITPPPKPPNHKGDPRQPPPSTSSPFLANAPHAMETSLSRKASWQKVNRAASQNLDVRFPQGLQTLCNPFKLQLAPSYVRSFHCPRPKR
jgi:hypothetical protein